MLKLIQNERLLGRLLHQRVCEAKS